jgi:hypothetical protein
MDKNDDSCSGPSESRRKFEFTVDCEDLVAYSEGDTAELTVREILDMSGNQPPEQYHLVQVAPERAKFEELDRQIRVQSNARFKALFRGPTPVS